MVPTVLELLVRCAFERLSTKRLNDFLLQFKKLCAVFS